MRAILTIVLAVCSALSVLAPVQAKETLRIGMPWGEASPYAQAVREVAKRYEELHPGADLELMYGVARDKFFALIAGGVPPDATVGGFGSDVAAFVPRGAFTSLTTYVKRDGVDPGDFWSPAWQQVVYQGEIWALPAWVDPNFALLANGAHLEQAGLGTKVPRTVPELDIAAEKLTRRQSDGRIGQLGFQYWQVLGSTFNTMVTWFWAYGGTSLCDEATQKTQFDSPEMIRAMSWLADRYAKYAPDAAGVAPFLSGGISMWLNTGAGNVRQALTAFPDLVTGVTPYHPDAGTDSVAWVGGHIATVPRGVANPERSWQFVRFFSATHEGSMQLAKAGLISGYRNPAANAYLRQDAAQSVMLAVLEKAVNIRPRGVEDLVRVHGEPVYQQLLRGQVPPRAGLEQLNQLIQHELDAARAK